MTWKIKVIWPAGETTPGMVEHIGPFYSPFWTRAGVEAERAKWMRNDRERGHDSFHGGAVLPTYIIEEVTP